MLRITQITCIGQYSSHTYSQSSVLHKLDCIHGITL